MRRSKKIHKTHGNNLILITDSSDQKLVHYTKMNTKTKTRQLLFVKILKLYLKRKLFHLKERSKAVSECARDVSKQNQTEPITVLNATNVF